MHQTSTNLLATPSTKVVVCGGNCGWGGLWDTSKAVWPWVQVCVCNSGVELARTLQPCSANFCDLQGQIAELVKSKNAYNPLRYPRHPFFNNITSTYELMGRNSLSQPAVRQCLCPEEVPELQNHYFILLWILMHWPTTLWST